MCEDLVCKLLDILKDFESLMDTEMHHALDDIEYAVKTVLEPVCRDLVIDWNLDCWAYSCRAKYLITCSGNTYRVVAYISDYHTAYVDSVSYEDEDEQ
jgi:hypothetical protein